VSYRLTCGQPPGLTGYRRRIDAALLEAIARPAETNPLVGLGYPPERVKTERFGATGG